MRRLLDRLPSALVDDREERRPKLDGKAAAVPWWQSGATSADCSRLIRRLERHEENRRRSRQARIWAIDKVVTAVEEHNVENGHQTPLTPDLIVQVQSLGDDAPTIHTPAASGADVWEALMDALDPLMETVELGDE